MLSTVSTQTQFAARNLAGPQAGVARQCPAAAAQPGPGRPHINSVKLMLTRSYTDLLQPDPLLSQLVKAAPQSCLAGGKSTRYYESVATVGPTEASTGPVVSQLVKNMASSSAGDDAPVKAVMVNSVPGAESVESSAKSADLQTFTKPQWYHGQKLPNTLTRISGQKNRLGDLEFEILHEILVEKMNNPHFSVDDMSKFLGVNVDTIYPALWRHNSELIEFGSLARDTPVKHDKIKTRSCKWREYRKFIDEQGGCSNPYNPAVAACLLFPQKGMEASIVKNSPKPAEWSGGWRQGRLSGLSRDSRLAKVADQVSGIVPSSGDQSPPFPPPTGPTSPSS